MEHVSIWNLSLFVVRSLSVRGGHNDRVMNDYSTSLQQDFFVPIVPKMSLNFCIMHSNQECHVTLNFVRDGLKRNAYINSFNGYTTETWFN